MTNPTYDKLQQLIGNAIVAHNHGVPGTMTQNVLDAIWPEIEKLETLIHHYEVVVANAYVRLGSLSEELNDQIVDRKEGESRE